ncbi:UvrB/UvrC motif-containing protein [Clostridium cellulovorans]|uniref:UvrB/UvrC protein n=1 Tax=Clostridium cellulovorans (strain ATCC 35296 / DSM 3052 / OCM 3 / 743B) TaxID=573061 RepID=D9SXC9_CLOC7|nr:UvrB/UvrC motif-containing protein [Clostridium cellulovorans]ADL53432.1 UvrB/UvrC protein [Clostridium cellulovorans 743B]
MICEKCKENEATIHIEKYINGEKEEMNLCEKCAKETGAFGMMGSSIFGDFTFQNILSGFMDYVNIGKSSNDIPKTEVTCSGCGTTLSEFSKKGIVGCDTCYKDLGSYIMPIVKKVQKNVEHKGKIPEKLEKTIKNKKYLLKLKEELQKAILEENFEHAAELRDEIKGIQAD